MKVSISELTESVKEELLCYENAEEIAKRWETEFLQWLKQHKGKHKDIVSIKDTMYLKIKDEDEIFEMADSYMDSMLEGSVKKYWETF